MLTAKKVKEYAKKCGADIVGIGSMDRFEGAPKEMDPRYIFPEAKAIIGFGFRIPRGCFRGIEEGTYFAAYPSMGYAGINLVYAPSVLREVVCMIENEGYEAVPIQNMVIQSSVDILQGKKEISACLLRQENPRLTYCSTSASLQLPAVWAKSATAKCFYRRNSDPDSDSFLCLLTHRLNQTRYLKEISATGV